MQSRILSGTGKFIASVVLASILLNGATTVARAQSTNPPTVAPTPVAVPIPAPVPVVPATPQPDTRLLELLTWDAVQKEQTTLPGQATADFVFTVTNPSDTDVIIDHVRTSCGCTVAKLPSEPWTLTPHTNGEIKVSVNLAGKSGIFTKVITVLSSNDQKALIIQVHMPDTPEMMRGKNQQVAMADPQAIFKGECAKCHVEPTVGVMGQDLYVKACGICHDASPRATMVADLHHLPHPTDYAFWKQIITVGKPQTMMPGFSVSHGGPLSDAQVESLAKLLTQEIPSPAAVVPPPATAVTNAANPNQLIGVPPPVRN